MHTPANEPALKYSQARLVALVQQVSQRQEKRMHAVEEESRVETRGDAQTAAIRSGYAALMRDGFWS